MSNTKKFEMVILGRIIEHLGSMMYKHRSPSIAELVANCWDAGAERVWITVPEKNEYSPENSKIVIMDSGEGMDENSIQSCYLIVGRNRRQEQGTENHNRKIMGRKGIGKLAGFGLADNVRVITWKKGSSSAIRFDMPLSQLKKTKAGDTETITFPWENEDKQKEWPESGTRIELSSLRHTTAIDIDSLKETLSRRFSRTVHGEMKIFVNDIEICEPQIDVIYSSSEDGGFCKESLKSGQVVMYRYKFSQKPIPSKEMQGFTIQANERTAQAPPFFFNVETTASSQHSTRYLTGEIIADFIDEGDDDQKDRISTDRQELDWEKEELAELREWGESLTRRLLRECAELHGTELENWVLADEEFQLRLNILDPACRKEIGGFLKILGQKTTPEDERTRSLADSLIRAYEFRVFHDVIDDIQKVGDDPEKLEDVLGRLHDWKVLESRAILEIVQGRLSIINKLEHMIINDTPETASSRTHDNLHDLLAEYPWMFNPDWQVFTEEKSVGKQLREWGIRDYSEDMKNKRVDFLAFGKDGELVIIEMKRPSHAVEYNEIRKLDDYQVELQKVHPNCRKVLLYGGTLNVASDQKKESLQNQDDLELLQWSEMFARARRYYAHYEAVLKGDVHDPKFASKINEVVRTRQVLETTAHRSKEDRQRGLGSPDP
ncbi:MAG: ATP-binding protein [Planctomycetaceae bacterium]|jgi:hypothetical protein|nr:ATP-binding protein [Planctomycetaceae bacterium]